MALISSKGSHYGLQVEQLQISRGIFYLIFAQKEYLRSCNGMSDSEIHLVATLDTARESIYVSCYTIEQFNSFLSLLPEKHPILVIFLPGALFWEMFFSMVLASRASGCLFGHPNP